MIPTDIGPHPDAPNYYLTMGRPPSMTDEECGSLSVRRVAATGDMACEPAVRIVQQERDGGEPFYPCFMSEWRPTEDELVRLNKGEPVRMLVVGNNLPPVSMWVRGESEI